jgi:lipopolysaccharide transport system ATP-binding protein
MDPHKPISISVNNLCKQYKLGGPQEPYHTFRDAIVKSLKTPLKAFYKEPAVEGFWALKNVSFKVEQGEVVGIIGRNGAGKSTLLKILSRITAPTEGTIELHGRVGSLLEVGTGFHPELTGRENIYLSGSILGMKRQEIDDKLNNIVKFSEIEKFLDTPVKRYSSGMYVRLAFAVAAHLEPEILLVDEVLAVGDATFQKKCLGKMGEVAKEGRTVLFVSHNMGAIASLCNRVIYLSNGKIIEDNSSNLTISKYMHDNFVSLKTKSLIHHPNRPKQFHEFLTKFWMDNEEEIAYYGKPLTFHIQYYFEKSIRNPQFAVLFNTYRGECIFSLNSQWQENNLPPSLSGEGTITCKIQSLPLLPGDYFLTIMLWEIGQQYDQIDNVANLKVEWVDRKPYQNPWDSNQGMVYVDAEWKLS